MKTTAKIRTLPYCNFCLSIAKYDGRTTYGYWAYMCQNHFDEYGVGLGLGKGQLLIKEKKVQK